MVEVIEPSKDRGGLKERRRKWNFSFDRVFSNDHGQQDVWDAAEPLVQSVIDGFDVTMFAYGQTGSGKTYTMLGEAGNEGLVVRCVRKLFKAKRDIMHISKGETTAEVSIELVEIYQEKVKDLIRNGNTESHLQVVANDVVGNYHVKTETEDELMQILEMAQSQRCVKATASNAASSRSHMVCTIHFDVITEGDVQRQAKLHICDLAGSERLDKSGANSVGGSLLEETKHINLSLSVLSNVIERLQKGEKNVPFRESKLTQILKESLQGDSKTLAIVCCNPLVSNLNESLCSLRFAEKVNRVQLKSAANFSC